MTSGKKILILCTVITFAAGGLLGYWFAGRGFSAKEEPSQMEEFLARKARALAMPSDAKAVRNPLPSSPENLKAGREHWVGHCATCHALDGSGNTSLGKNMYPKAPDMRMAATQNLSDGELSYIIQNGIRLSGMPAWGAEHTADDNWQLVQWIRHLPKLTPEETKAMEQEAAEGTAKGVSKPHEHSPGAKPHKH